MDYTGHTQHNPYTYLHKKEVPYQFVAPPQAWHVEGDLK